MEVVAKLNYNVLCDIIHYHTFWYNDYQYFIVRLNIQLNYLIFSLQLND